MVKTNSTFLPSLFRNDTSEYWNALTILGHNLTPLMNWQYSILSSLHHFCGVKSHQGQIECALLWPFNSTCKFNGVWSGPWGASSANIPPLKVCFTVFIRPPLGRIMPFGTGCWSIKYSRQGTISIWANLCKTYAEFTFHWMMSGSATISKKRPSHWEHSTSLSPDWLFGFSLIRGTK